jgi:hypothetical protein
MSLKLNSSGGGSVTLQEPTTASNVTLNLPAADGTVVYENASGNVGIGTSSPNRAVSIYRSSSPVLQLIDATTGTTANDGLLIQQVGVDTYIENAEAGFMQFRTSATERARIDSSGRLLIGTTSATVNPGVSIEPSGRINIGRSNDDAVAEFYRSGTRVGQINVTTTATSYITSSDYRLKEEIQPMTGALAKVAALKPCTYKWKSDGSDGQGFIAHELAEVVPQCVSGEKDATDDDGNPQYQGIDTSFLVATLTAGLQEAVAMIDELKAKVAALEAQ